jgi:hypothetical protein
MTALTEVHFEKLTNPQNGHHFTGIIYLRIQKSSLFQSALRLDSSVGGLCIKGWGDIGEYNVYAEAFNLYIPDSCPINTLACLFWPMLKS